MQSKRLREEGLVHETNDNINHLGLHTVKRKVNPVLLDKMVLV